MAICMIIWKAFKVWRALSRMKETKANAYRKSIGLPPKYGCCYTLLLCCGRGLQAVFLRLLCPCFFWKIKGRRTVWQSIRTEGTLANSIAKSLLGLIVGLMFTHAIVIFLIFQLNFDPVMTTYVAMLLGSILTFGLAFSETTRCFLFLTIPQFFTKKGRTAILAYCLILALSGPAKNTTRNMEILTESLLCSQEMAQNATQGLIDLVKDPYSALGGALKGMVDAVKDTAASIMTGLRHLMKMITAVVNAVKAALKWLKEILSFCNSKVGSPSTKCRAAFDEGMADCRERLDKVFRWMCSVVTLAKNLCYLAQWTEALLCWLPGLIKESVLDPIMNGLKDIGAGIKTFFDVRIRFDYTLEASFTSSKSFREVVHGMKGEILEEIHWLLDYMDWVNILLSLFMAMALYKALIYRYRFRTIDRYDNFYITKGVVQLDLRMRRIGRNPVFPLKYREAYTYVHPFSLVLVESEKKALKQQLFFVGLGALKILIYVFIDYVFYLFLLLVRKYGAFHVDTRKLLGHGVVVQGHGFMADMYRAIFDALSPIGSMLPVFDTSPCLPIPSKPNYYRYAMIFFLVLLCFLACVTEPYGMRFRHVICGIYYPERKLARDRWLYTHIVSSRDNFLSFARNELRGMMSNGKTYRVGLVERLSHTSPCFRFFFALLRMRRKKCFLCGLTGDMDDSENFVHCPSCDSIYCKSCYEEVGARCVVCISPMEFGDISEETGSHSSDDDVSMKNEVAKILKRKNKGKIRRPTKSRYSPVSSDDQRSPLLSSDSESEEGLSDITSDESLETLKSSKMQNLTPLSSDDQQRSPLLSSDSESEEGLRDITSDESPETLKSSKMQDLTPLFSDDQRSPLLSSDSESEEGLRDITSDESPETLKSSKMQDLTPPSSDDQRSPLLSSDSESEEDLSDITSDESPETLKSSKMQDLTQDSTPEYSPEESQDRPFYFIDSSESVSRNRRRETKAVVSSSISSSSPETSTSSAVSTSEETYSDEQTSSAVTEGSSDEEDANAVNATLRASKKIPGSVQRSTAPPSSSHSSESSETELNQASRDSASPISTSFTWSSQDTFNDHVSEDPATPSSRASSRESPASMLQHVVMTGLDTSSSDSKSSESSDSNPVTVAQLRKRSGSSNGGVIPAVRDSTGSESTSSDSSAEHLQLGTPLRIPAEVSPSFSNRPKFSRRSIPRRRINSVLAERIARLDSFYAKMPYPPGSNVYQ